MTDPRLVTERCVVRLATPEDAPAVLAYWVANGARYSPPLPAAMLQQDVWRDRAIDAHAAFTRDEALRLCVFDADDRTMIGTITFSNIRRAEWCSCALGFGVAGSHEGRGVMFEAVTASIRYVFDVLNLRRIEAGHDVANARSGALLVRLGFLREGVSREHLWIDDRPRDHVRLGLLNPTWRPPQCARLPAGRPAS